MSEFSRREALKLTAAVVAGAFAPSVFAQTDTALKLVVTFPPGGSTDITARIIQPKLAERMGRSVVVDNRPGAASQVGTQFVAKAAPDSKTVLVCFDTHPINPIAKKNLPYDTFKDFVGVTLAVRFPLVIGANPSVPGKNLKEFLEAAKWFGTAGRSLPTLGDPGVWHRRCHRRVCTRRASGREPWHRGDRINT